MGTLYRHFPTKDALVQAVIHDVLEATIRMARDAAGKPDGTGLEHFLEASGAFQAERAGCLPRLWDTDHEMVRAARACISGLLADAQRHGRIRSDLTSTDLTMVMFSIRGIVETTSSVAPAAWRRHLDLLIAGMRPSAEVLPHGPLGSGQIDAILSTRIDARRGATRVAN
jgi:AcrR family transcriptional regulator